MDSEVTNLAQVKAFDSSDYATAAQGTTADAALPKAGGAMTGAITTNSTFDGRDVATDGTKLDGIEASADVTDATNVTAAGALMDSEVTNLAQVKAFNSADYATAAQGTTADAALPKAGGAMTGAITTNSTFDGRDVATDGTKLDGIEASADVTDTANVTAAGALMDSELTAIASVKALNQGVATTDSPAFAGLTVDTTTLAVDSTNNRVGIGTASATSNLEVSDSTQATGATLSITNSHEGSWASGNKIGSIDFRIDDGSASEKVRAKVHSESGTTGTFPSDSDLVFSTASVNTLGEAMRIDSAGQVGIGTTSPSQALTVNGTDARIYLTGANTDIAMDNSANGQLSLDGNAYGFGIALNADGAQLYTNSATRDLIFGVNETEVARLTPTNFTVTAPTDPTITVKATAAGDADADIILDANDTGESGVIFNNSGVKKARIDWSNQNLQLNMATESGTNGTIDFQPNDVLAMRITAAGVAEFKAGITEDSVTLSGTTTTIDLATATNFVHDLSGNTTYTFSNPAASGNASAFTLKIIQGSTARTITWPASVDWAGGTAPTLSTANNAVDIFTFFTLDGGTTYYGFTAGQAMA